MFDTDKFIQCIQEHPALWEKSCKEYSDRNIREKSWFTIGGNMFDEWEENTDQERQEKVKEMKTKWRHIRDSFCKYINQGASGDAAPSKKKKYVYADALSFLLQNIEKRRTSGNMIHDENDDRNASQVTQEIGDSETAISAIPNNEKGSAIYKNASVKKTPSVRMADCTSFQAQLLEKLDTSKNNEEDADRTFLLSVLPSLKKLNEDEKLDFRFHTLQFFRNLREKNRQQPIQQPPNPFQSYNYPQSFRYLATNTTSHQPPQHNSLHSAPYQTTPLPSLSPCSPQLSVHSNESSVHSQLSEYLNSDL